MSKARPSGGRINVFCEKELPKPGKPGRPNTEYHFITPGGKGPEGQKKIRLTGPDGRPIRDEHFNHRDDGTHIFPHFQDWIDGKLSTDWYKINELTGEREYGI